MKETFSMMLALALSFSSASAADNGTSHKFTFAQKAKLNAQAATLRKNRLQDAEHSKRAVSDEADRQKQAIDEKLKQQHDEVDLQGHTDAWFLGPEAAKHCTDQHKHQLTQEAQAEKDKVDAAARKRTDAHAAKANEHIEKINQSVEGLHSQVKKQSEFGLKPTGSNLHVRHYGH